MIYCHPYFGRLCLIINHFEQKGRLFSRVTSEHLSNQQQCLEAHPLLSLQARCKCHVHSNNATDPRGDVIAPCPQTSPSWDSGIKVIRPCLWALYRKSLVKLPPRVINVDHKTSHNSPFLKSRFIHHLCHVWFVMIGQYLKIWNLRVQKNRNIEKIIFKVVQMKFLAMHINNQKFSFDIFTVGNVLNIFIKHDLYIISNDFWHKRKMYNFDPYNVLLANAINIPMLLIYWTLSVFYCPFALLTQSVLFKLLYR